MPRPKESFEKVEKNRKQRERRARKETARRAKRGLLPIGAKPGSREHMNRLTLQHRPQSSERTLQQHAL